MAGESARDQARRAREKSERLVQCAEKWEKGADGETQTAAALAQLGAEWTHLHDLKWPGRKLANIDHLAIGPGGIFVIDSKNWSGTITVKDHVLRQNGYRRETAVAGCAEAALAVGELLPHYLDRLKPVICFVRNDEVEGWARDVMLCSTANLVEMLTSRPRVLSDFEVAEAAVALRARVTAKPNGGVSTLRARRVRENVPIGPSSPVAPAGPNARKRLPRFFVGLGIWFCFMVVVGGILGAFPAHADGVITPAALAGGVVSWLFARRIIR